MSSTIDSRRLDSTGSITVPNYINISDTILKIRSVNDLYITNGLVSTSATTIYFDQAGVLKWTLLRNTPNTGGAGTNPIGDVCYLNGIFWYLILDSTVSPPASLNEQYALMGIDKTGTIIYNGRGVNDPSLRSTMGVTLGYPSWQVRMAAGFGKDMLFFIAKMDSANSGSLTRATVHVDISVATTPVFTYDDDTISTANPNIANSMYDNNCDAFGLNDTAITLITGFNKVVFLYNDVTAGNYKAAVCKVGISSNSTAALLTLTSDPQSISLDPVTKDLWILNTATSELKQQTAVSNYATTTTDETLALCSDSNPPRAFTKTNITI